MQSLIFFIIVIFVLIHTVYRWVKQQQMQPPAGKRRYAPTDDDLAKFFQSVKRAGPTPGRPTSARPDREAVEITSADIVPEGRRAPGRRPGYRRPAEAPPEMDIRVIKGEDIVEESARGIGISAEELEPEGPALTTAGIGSIKAAEEAIQTAPVSAAARKRQQARQMREIRKKRQEKRRLAAPQAKERERLMRMLTAGQQRQERMRRAMAKLFDSKGDFRRGIIMLEVLGAPKGLREDY